jgi:diguanylate cyclase (GGDEF)-like protein/PAS domain S-box-containing protein
VAIWGSAGWPPLATKLPGRDPDREREDIGRSLHRTNHTEVNALARTDGRQPPTARDESPAWQTGGWRARGRSAALMYGAGGILAAAALLSPAAAAAHRGWILVLCVVACLGSAAIFALGPRYTEVLAHGMGLAGSVIVGAGVALGRGTFLSVVYVMLFVWIAQASAIFFSPRRALEQVLFSSFIHAVALTTLPAGPRAATWLLTTGTCHVVLAFHRLMDRHSARLRGIVEHSGAAVAVVGKDGTIQEIGGAGRRLDGTLILDLFHPDDVRAVADAMGRVARAGAPVSLEARARHSSGSWIPVEANLENALHDASLQGIVITIRDVTERKRLEDELAHQANHDLLTGLPNRVLFADRVRQELSGRGTDLCAALFIDLDHFKDVNDALGHAAGDALLEAVAARFDDVLRAGDIVARLGGDEFGVLLRGIADPSEGVVVAGRILDALLAPFQVAASEVHVTASIGIAVAQPGGSAGVDELLRDADLAMNMAKNDGRSRSRLFQADMHTHLLDRVELEADLRRAMERDELVLHYQPLVDIESTRVIGVEALIRWNHPKRGLVPPLQFIPLAEETGLIVRVGRWVLDAACNEGASLAPAGEPIHISVNLSARQLLDPILVDNVRSALARSGLPPERLVLEITESVVAGNLDVTRTVLEELRSMGVRIAIDDFGSGYSSLRYLKTLPVDILKIDRAFVKGLGLTPKDGALTDAIVMLGHSLGLTTVAEGIESEAQLDHLRRAGCDVGQGFLFAAPMPLPELREFLAHPVSRAVALDAPADAALRA